MCGTLFRQIVVTFHLLPHLNGQSSRLTYRLFITSLDFCRMTACALVRHFQPRFIISECCTRYRTHLYNVFLDYYQCHLRPYNPVHTCFHVYVTTFTCENKDVDKIRAYRRDKSNAHIVLDESFKAEANSEHAASTSQREAHKATWSCVHSTRRRTNVHDGQRVLNRQTGRHQWGKHTTRRDRQTDRQRDRQTVNRWRTVVSATWKYDDPRLNMSHEGAARVWHVQPRVVTFPCRTNYRVSYVLSSDQLQESWIICKLKSFSPMYLDDLNTQDRRVIFGVSKTLCDFGHKKFFYRRIN